MSGDRWRVARTGPLEDADVTVTAGTDGAVILEIVQPGALGGAVTTLTPVQAASLARWLHLDAALGGHSDLAP